MPRVNLVTAGRAAFSKLMPGDMPKAFGCMVHCVLFFSWLQYAAIKRDSPSL